MPILHNPFLKKEKGKLTNLEDQYYVDNQID